MSRSIKKGPYVAPELLKRVEEMNKTGEKNVLKTWRIWSVTSWVSSLPPAPSAATPSLSKEDALNNGS